jgi:hypothetical protein
MVIAVSTSGNSPNLIYALEEARPRGLLTIAFSGKDGGRLADAAEYCFTVPSYSIHRIQESHVALPTHPVGPDACRPGRGRRDLMDRAAAGRGGQIPMPMFFGPTKSMNVFSITHRGFF